MGVDERIDEGVFRLFGMWRGRGGIGLPRESMEESVLLVVQWVDRAEEEMN